MSPADTTAAIAEARLLLPHWGPWLRIVGYPALAFFVTLLACSLAAFVAQWPLWKCPRSSQVPRLALIQSWAFPWAKGRTESTPSSLNSEPRSKYLHRVMKRSNDI
jgi:hypothetical protein